jgi:hypothetical protein
MKLKTPVNVCVLNKLEEELSENDKNSSDEIVTLNEFTSLLRVQLVCHVFEIFVSVCDGINRNVQFIVNQHFLERKNFVKNFLCNKKFRRTRYYSVLDIRPLNGCNVFPPIIPLLGHSPERIVK